MNHFLLSALTGVLVAASAPSGAEAPAPRKRALIIAVNGYDAPRPKGWRAIWGEWDPLHTCADALQVSEMLVSSRFGFSPDDVHVVSTPAETTHASITRAIRSCLITPTRPGDVVYLHYSGHGSRAPDDNTLPGNRLIGDEADGWDETLVPSDSLGLGNPTNDIRDDDISLLLRELAARKPASVTLVFDCCHSGTVTRAGRMLVRGAASRGPKPPVRHPPTRLHLAEGTGILDEPGSPPPTLVTVYACRSDQRASETLDEAGKAMGLLTYAWTRALLNAPVEASYRTAFEWTAAVVAGKDRYQEPQIEGPVDRAVIGIGGLPPAPYLMIDVRQRQPLVRAGYLHGVTPGSVLAIYSPGTTDFASTSPLTEATVTEALSTTAHLRLSTPGIPDESLRDARAQIRFRNWSAKALAVDLSPMAGHRLEMSIRDAIRPLEKSGMIITRLSPAREWDVRLSPVPAPNREDPTAAIQMENHEGTALVANLGSEEAPRYASVLPATWVLPRQVRSILEKESRWRLVTGLRSEGPTTVDVQLRVWRIEVMRNAAGMTVVDSMRRPTVERTLWKLHNSRKVALTVGDWVAVEVENTGSKGTYVTVLDLSSDGSITPIWPHPRAKGDNYWPPHTMRILAWPDGKQCAFRIGEPTGRELFKAFATAEPSDFSIFCDPEVLRGRPLAAEVPGASTPLGQRLLFAVRGTRGVTLGCAPSSWAVAESWFYISRRR